MPPKKNASRQVRPAVNPRDPFVLSREFITGDPMEHFGDSQAKRILCRFGGVQSFLKCLLSAGVRRTAQSVYHWVREGGIIPPNGVRDVFLAEVQAGIHLTDEDWSPYVVTEAPAPVYKPDPPSEPKAPPERAPEGPPVVPKRWVL